MIELSITRSGVTKSVKVEIPALLKASTGQLSIYSALVRPVEQLARQLSQMLSEERRHESGFVRYGE